MLCPLAPEPLSAFACDLKAVCWSWARYASGHFMALGQDHTFYVTQENRWLGTVGFPGRLNH